jgi:hypothetical protein
LTLADDLLDLKWSHTLDVRLARGTIRANIATVEPNLVSNMELRHGFCMAIVVGFVPGLGMLQVVAEHSVELAELFDETLGSGINRLGRRRHWQEIARVVSRVGNRSDRVGFPPWTDPTEAISVLEIFQTDPRSFRSGLSQV